MFHLEQSITAWRKQMLAAGISFPVPLEELEAHLREEIDRQLQAGLSESDAFHAAVQTLGPAVQLKTEFTKTAGFWARFGDTNFVRTNRILGILWAGESLYFILLGLFWMLRDAKSNSLGIHTAGFLIFTLVSFLPILLGLIGGLCLFRGAKFGRLLILFLAWLDLAIQAFLICAQLAGMPRIYSFSMLDSFIIAFDLFTLWLLHSRKFGNPKPAR